MVRRVPTPSIVEFLLEVQSAGEIRGTEITVVVSRHHN